MFYIILLAGLFATASTLESNFHSEESCSSKGGYCVLENECPHAINAAYKNLCEIQKSQGAVCCQNLPIEKLNCNQSHNVCRKPEECPKNLNMGQKGCTGGEICCTLV